MGRFCRQWLLRIRFPWHYSENSSKSGIYFLFTFRQCLGNFKNLGLINFNSVRGLTKWHAYFVLLFRSLAPWPTELEFPPTAYNFKVLQPQAAPLQAELRPGWSKETWWGQNHGDHGGVRSGGVRTTISFQRDRGKSSAATTIHIQTSQSVFKVIHHRSVAFGMDGWFYNNVEKRQSDPSSVNENRATDSVNNYLSLNM